MKFKVVIQIVMVQDNEIRQHSVKFVESIAEAFAIGRQFEEESSNRGFMEIWEGNEIVIEKPMNAEAWVGVK